MAYSPLLGFVISATMLIISVIIFRFFPLHTPPFSPTQKLFTSQELALYNGTDDALPILLAILGSVFDVSKGKSHYGVGGGYHHFSGRDASRAFVSGNFTGDGLTDSLQDLSSSEVKSVVEWRAFYLKTYLFTGKLVGRYYDNEGNPTKYLKGAEAKAARGAQLLEKQKIEEAKLPTCNSKWSQDEGSEWLMAFRRSCEEMIAKESYNFKELVWCESGFPRLVQKPLEMAISGKVSKRCACFNEDQLDQPGLEVYQGCGHLSKLCRL